MGVDIKTYTYDGDTRNAAPEVHPAGGAHRGHQPGHAAHADILPHHTKWVKLFENLRYIVIDEIHTYRGVFGSPIWPTCSGGWMRLCEFYGSHPQYILCSATIAESGGAGRRL